MVRFLIVQDYKENRRKCTLTPLEAHEDVAFLRLSGPSPSVREPLPKVSLAGGVLLRLGAPLLTRADRELLGEGPNSDPVVLVDSTWARVPSVMSRLEFAKGSRLHERSLPPELATAYPRTSKLYSDPAEGLASVEAVFAVTAILGEPRPEFLQEYRWSEAFLRHNHRVFQQFRMPRT